MNEVAQDFKDKGVVFFVVYTREPHAGQKMGQHDFSDKKQTTTHKERVDYAFEMIEEHLEGRPVLIDEFGDTSVQKTIGGGRPNSLVVIDKDGKVALWQAWANAAQLRTKLEAMTAAEADKKTPAEKTDASSTDNKETGSKESGD